MAVDPAGSVYLAGGGAYLAGGGPISYDGYLVAKHNISGQRLWSATYRGGETNNLGRLMAMALDSQGNACVTGLYIGDWTAYDLATVKYDANGNQLWAQRLTPGQWYADRAYLAVDRADNVLVGSGYGGYDYLIIKYDKEGNLLWTTRYNFLYADTTLKMTAMALDDAGNVYATGTAPGLGGVPFYDTDFVTIKVDPGGNVLWAARFNDPQNGSDSPLSLAVNRAGEVYVAGSWVVKYDTNGKQLWVRDRTNGGHGVSLDKVTGSKLLTGWPWLWQICRIV